MKVEKTSRSFMPFKDHYKKSSEKKKELQQKKVDKKPSEKKEVDNLIGWA